MLFKRFEIFNLTSYFFHLLINAVPIFRSISNIYMAKRINYNNYVIQIT